MLVLEKSAQFLVSCKPSHTYLLDELYLWDFTTPLIAEQIQVTALF